MTIRYVGPGGSNANNGTSWATRKLTLNGVEDTPVAAGDTVYVAPGTYRETLTADVSGTAGNPITYIGDVTGANTDGIGGYVRLTASDNDLTGTRSYCIYNTTRAYRTFRGIMMDYAVSQCIGTTARDLIVEDCFFQLYGGSYGIYVSGTGQLNNIFRRNIFIGGVGYNIFFTHTSTVNDTNQLIENCMFMNGFSYGVANYRIGGITIKNSNFHGLYRGIAILASPASGQKLYAYNNLISGCNHGLVVTADADITEDYNNIINNNAHRYGGSPANWAGAHDNTTNMALFEPPMLVNGAYTPWQFGRQASYSPFRNITGSSESTTDLFGLTRPETSSKRSWGAIQYHGVEQSTAHVHAGTNALRLPDAGRVQFIVPTSAVSTTISCYVYRHAGYTGTLPQMVIKQAGQADRTTTDTGAATTWNQLTDTFTPAASPPYCIVELVSNNTATPDATTDCFFDDLLAT